MIALGAASVPTPTIVNLPSLSTVSLVAGNVSPLTILNWLSVEFVSALPSYTESITNLSALVPSLTINFSELVLLTDTICTNSPDGHDADGFSLR